MRFLTKTIISSVATLLLSACIHKSNDKTDPYETINRKTYKFNQAFDATFLKPLAKIYLNVLPAPVRSGVNNFYDNINLIPSTANDLLQAEFNYALKDSWRFIINSTFGIAGIFDVAKRFNLPPHSNDLGITFAKWGDKNSPYFIIPFLGPSTFRDGMGLMFNYAILTPYPYLNDNLTYTLIGIRYVDLRSQMLETDKLLNEGLDKYTFMRDAYLQHRNYLITGQKEDNNENDGALYVDDSSDSMLPEEPENGTPSEFPLTTAMNSKTTQSTG